MRNELNEVERKMQQALQDAGIKTVSSLPLARRGYYHPDFILQPNGWRRELWLWYPGYDVMKEPVGHWIKRLWRKVARALLKRRARPSLSPQEMQARTMYNPPSGIPPPHPIEEAIARKQALIMELLDELGDDDE